MGVQKANNEVQSGREKVPVQKSKIWSKIAFTGLRGKKEQCANKPNVNIEKLLLKLTKLTF